MPAQYEDVRASRVALVGFLGAIVIFVLIVALQVLYYRYTSEETLRDQQEPCAELAALAAQQQALLGRYAWVNAQKKIAAVPIDRAMELVVAELGERRERDRTEDRHAP